MKRISSIPNLIAFLLLLTLARVACASTYADDFPAALSNYVYGGWQGPFGDGTAGRLFPTADGTGIYMDATYNGYVWALRSSPEFSDADMTVRFVLPNRDNTEADWFGLWMLAHNPTTPPGGSCTTVCPFVVPESGLWLQFRVGFNQLVVTRFDGGVAVSSTIVPLPLVALNQPHDARAVYQGGSLMVSLDSVQLLNWPAPDVPAGQVGFEVYRTDMIVDATNVVAGPGPPTLAAIANMTVAPGTTADQGISASDPDADAIIFTSSGPSFMTLTQDAQVGTTCTGNIHLAPPLATSGTFQASVTATANGQFDDQLFAISVHTNNPPALAQPADMTVNEGTTADQMLTGSDPDGDALTFTMVAGPTFMTVTTSNATTGNIHLAPGFPDAGSYAATVRASDASASDIKSFAITVNDVRFPPVLAPIANINVAPGGTADRAISASDQDGDAITFTSSGPPFMALTQNAQVGNTRTGNIHLAPPLGTSGAFQASVTATAQDGFDDQTFSITVSSNQAPVLSQPANMFVAAGQTADQPITGTDPNGDPLTFARVSGPFFMTVTTTNPGSGTAQGNIHLAPSFSDFGSFSASVSVTDGTFTDTKSFTITVTDCHSVPVLAQPANMTVAQGATADQVITATDACGDALTFTKVAGSTFMTVTTINATTGNIHLAPGFSDFGTFAATVRASNGLLNNDKSFTITIASSQRPPVLAQPANMTVTEGATADQVLGASDPDGDALTFFKVFGPLFMTVTTTAVNPPRGNVHLAPGFADAGTYAATVAVSDGSLSNQKSFAITVNPGVNRCPFSNPGGPYSGLAGVPISFDGSASSDPDGTPLTYAWDFDASDGVSVDATGPTPSHTYAAGGTFTVTLTVSDGLCTISATTSADILPFCPATVFNGYDVIRLGSGRHTWFALVQPGNGCYANTDVVLSSFVLKYAGREIPADISKSTIDSDKSGDGIPEIRIAFSKDNLRTLFTGLPSGHSSVEVTVEANLSTGGFISGTTTVEVVSNGSFSAAEVSPNPFNPEAVLTFTTTRTGPVTVTLFDVAGRLVRTILDEPSLVAGVHEVRIDGRSRRGEPLSSGIYFIHGNAPEGAFQRTVVLLK